MNFIKFKIVVCCFITLFVANLQSIAQVKSEFIKIAVQNEKITVADFEKLNDTKKNIHNSENASLYKNILKEADEALNEGVFSVMEKTITPTSGSKHDYLSIGPYWWPDPKKADGLPWIRRDGEINPLTREGSTDYETKNNMFNNTNKLALAYFFSKKKEYGNKALELIKVWFLNSETKMNPNLNFAQGIPGENTGRGIGIIEFAGITKVLEAIEILEMDNLMDANTSNELRVWFTAYLHWLQTSDHGIFAKNTKNNHGTHYDNQVINLLLFLNRQEEAKQILEEAKLKRIANQIEPDGKQPHELERTKALSYSTMNLKGLTELAVLGKKLGVDLWNFKAENGTSIKQAFEFLKPYAKNEKVWNYQQITDKEKAIKSLKQLFVFAGNEFEMNDYSKIGTQKND